MIGADPENLAMYAWGAETLGGVWGRPSGLMVLYDGLRRTCSGCPDQWEANVTDLVNLYIRARHDRLRADLVGVPGVEHVTIWEAACPGEVSTRRMVDELAMGWITPTPDQLAAVQAMGEWDDCT